jgi:LuxR family maltose regulon positive regulatory protein
MVELSKALTQSGATIAWYALDSRDNDPNLFGSYLVQCLSESLQIEPALTPVARLLGSSAEFSIEQALPTIINAVASNDQNCLLFLDDYHFINSPAIHSALTFLLDHLPENMHIVIGSRSDPPLPLARLRARNQMAEIRAVDLKFTPDEATKFLNETMRLGLSPEAIAEIEKSTEGWITGLQLAALSIIGRAGGADFASRFGGSNRYLVEYLLQEVFERQPVDVQNFLLSTSVLERLCGPLCDAVLGRQSGSDTILKRLEQANLFLIALDDEGYWNRYHQLFRDFLRTRLEQNEPDRVSLLHRAASEWYASQNLLREAVSHALETRDWNYAAVVVEQHGMTMFTRSEISVLYKWCVSLPEEIFHTHPMLCILHGWTLGLSYKRENRRRVEERLQQVEQAASALEDKQRGQSLISQAALVRLVLGLIPDPAIDPEQELALAQRALDLLPGNAPLRSLAIAAIGYSYLALQNLPMASETLEEYKRLSLAGKNYYAATVATFYLASLAYYQGQFNRAKEICRQQQASIEQIFANPEQDMPAIGALDIIQGCVLLEENQLSEAERVLLRGLNLIIGTNNPYLRMIASIALFRLREIQGKEGEAVQFLNDLEGVWPDIAFCTQGLRLMHLIRIGPEDPQTLVQAESWCREFLQSFDQNTFLPGVGPLGAAQGYYVASLIWVRAQILLGKAGETLSYLKRQMDVAEAQGLTCRVIELSLAEAQARKTLGEDQRSFELLGRALKLAKTAGCVRIFDQGLALARLLREAARQGIASGYVAQILAIIGTSEQRDVSVLSSPGVKVGQETLSERELEVLRLMAAGASNKEMADQLVVTVGTIKSHINHILGKLDAHNRLEAVAHARELGLIKI